MTEEKKKSGGKQAWLKVGTKGERQKGKEEGGNRKMLLDDGQCELFFLWTPWNVFDFAYQK